MKVKLSFALWALLTLQFSCHPDQEPFCECVLPWIDSPQLVYEDGEVVKHQGRCWIAGHMVQADREEPGVTDAGHWEWCEAAEVQPCDCPNEWSMMLEYPAGAVVYFQDRCYIARLSSRNASPAINSGSWLVCE